MQLFWGVLAGILLIVEVIIPGLVAIWFSISAFIVLFLSFVIKDVNIQVFIFAVLSLILMLLTRKFVNTMLKSNNEKFNAEMKGEIVIISKIISKNKYEVKYKGVIWDAISDENFEIGQEAKIVKFKGNKIIIEKGE